MSLTDSRGRDKHSRALSMCFGNSGRDSIMRAHVVRIVRTFPACNLFAGVGLSRMQSCTFSSTTLRHVAAHNTHTRESEVRKAMRAVHCDIYQVLKAWAVGHSLQENVKALHGKHELEMRVPRCKLFQHYCLHHQLAGLLYALKVYRTISAWKVSDWY